MMQEHSIDRSNQIKKYREKLSDRIKKVKKEENEKILLTDFDKNVIIEKEKDNTENGLNQKYGKNAWYDTFL